MIVNYGNNQQRVQSMPWKESFATNISEVGELEEKIVPNVPKV